MPFSATKNIVTDNVTTFLLFSAIFFGLQLREQSEFGIALSVYKNTFFVF